MDNCSVHHVEDQVTELLRQAGIVVLFLPPYSPDLTPLEDLNPLEPLNPLEEAFGYVKGYLRKHELFQINSFPYRLDQDGI